MMKIINKSIDMINLFKADGEPRPIRFRVTNDDGEEYVYPIKGIASKVKEKCEGHMVWRFNVYIEMDGFQRLCEIRFYIMDVKWYLHKI
jgi:hypothetical protein